ncbi:MAG: hypothetical protein WA639_12080 [Candidatus Acidiferrum sp.]
MREIKNRTKIFIAGSRSVSRLGKDVKERIDNIVDKGLAVIVGDANGIDKAVQRYLDERRYRNVTVFCMEGGCRNNVGQWPMEKIAAADPSRRDFAYYSTKDRAMVDEADYGLMLWDGKSRGTLRSIIDLVRHSKPVIAYVAPANSFYTLRQSDDIAEMLSHVDPAALQGIEAELRSSAMAGGSGRKSDSLPLF